MKEKFRQTKKIFPNIETRFNAADGGHMLMMTNVRVYDPKSKNYYYVAVGEQYYTDPNDVDTVINRYQDFVMKCYRTMNLFIIPSDENQREQFGVVECKYSDISEKTRMLMIHRPDLISEIS